jgi:hypothetical protein
MNEAKFTRGEWEVYTRGLGEFKEIDILVPKGGFSITHMPDAEANAHLIAAAPYMYHMLEQLKNGEGLSPGDTIERLLAKARGES